ncbi:MAG TPA: LysM peptidoglycan-binding domain-containing protein [Chloroflexi bacterium]|jgi:LysM repeat protein|nr:LysM peptidoglycan-binding domain-containing protein [Chloroflexota bacterium]
MASQKFRLWYVPVAVAALVIVMQLISLASPIEPATPVAQIAEATPRPTRTPEPTATALPPTATVAATATPPATATPVDTPEPTEAPPATRTYVVQAGDTLSHIAYANGLSVAELAEANGLSTNAMLSIGQELVLPVPTEEANDAGAANATPTPEQADTPAPPTAEPTEAPTEPTPVPPTAEPTAVPPTPAPTAAPLGITQQIDVDNGEWGTGFILFKFAGDNEFYVQGPDGHRYRPFMGFLTAPEAIAKAQEIWTWAGRGSANWRMIVELREEVGWVSCPGDARVCWEESVHAGMASITSQVYLHKDQWAELIGAYNAGGVPATTQVSHYNEIQKAVFDPIHGVEPGMATIGFRFERID